MTARGIRITVFAAAAALAVGLALAAQQPVSVKRTVAFKTDMVGIPDREGIMLWAEIPVGGAEGRHSHPAEVFAFVVEGTITLENEGSPNATLKAGDTFHYVPGKWHQAINAGTTPVKLAAVFVAEKGKPLTTQVK